MTDNDNKENVFPDRLMKRLPTGFAEEAESAGDEDLKKIILQSEGNIDRIEKEKNADTKLNAAKEIIKDLGAPYRDAKSAQQAKIKYCLYLLENRGVALGD